MKDTSGFSDRTNRNKWKLLLQVKNILDKANVPFWIESGTLLGFLREKQFLSQSSAIHIGIRAEHLDTVISLKKKFRPVYKLVKTYERSGREWIDGNINSLYLKPFIKNKRNNFRLFITPRFIKGSTARWIDGVNGWVCKSASPRYFETFDSITVRNVTFPIPNNAEQYLHDRYGKWHSPIQKWDTNHDDGAIVSTKKLKSLPKKTRWTPPLKHKTKMMLTGKNLKRAKCLLADTGKMLDKHGIRWWLDHGTLLGIIRNNELIPYDHDMDVCAAGEDAEKFLAIKHTFYPKYRVGLRFDTSKRLPGKLRVAKVKFLLGMSSQLFSKEELHLDIFFNYRKDDGYSYWMDSCTLKRSPVKYYDTLAAVEWNNNSYPVPADTKEYLTYRFGDWRTPVQKYDSSLDDLAIVDE